MPADRDDLRVMDPTGVVDKEEHLALSAQGKALARFTHRILSQHFPGWRWGVTIDERGGVGHVFALELSGDMGYTFLLDDLYHDGNFDWKLVLMAGGELLERYGCPRGAKTRDWKKHVTWLNGVAIPDVTDKKKGLVQHFFRKAGLKAAQDQ